MNLIICPVILSDSIIWSVYIIMEFKKMLKKIILCIILIVLGLSLTSCQTIQGVGGDIQWTAKKCAGVLDGGKKAEAEEERY